MTGVVRFAVIIGSLAVWSLSGCAASAGAQGRPLVWIYPHAASETMAETPDEHYHRVSSVVAQDARSLSEDLDLFFLTNRTSRLTRWHSR